MCVCWVWHDVHWSCTLVYVAMYRVSINFGSANQLGSNKAAHPGKEVAVAPTNSLLWQCLVRCGRSQLHQQGVSSASSGSLAWSQAHPTLAHPQITEGYV